MKSPSVPAFAPDPRVSRAAGTAAFILLGCLVLVLPIAGTVALRLALLFLLLALSLWAFRKNLGSLVPPLLPPWGIYLAVALLSLTYAHDWRYSLNEIKNEIGYCFVAFCVAWTWVQTRDDFCRLLAVIAVGSTAYVSVAVFQGAAAGVYGDALIQAPSYRIGVGKLSTHIVFTFPLMLAFFFLSRESSRLLRAALALLLVGNLAALYFTGNRAGFLVLIAEALCFLAVFLFLHSSRNYRYQALTAVAVLLPWLAVGAVGLLLGRTEGSLAESIGTDIRWRVWAATWERLSDHPLSGGGFGTNAFIFLNPDYAEVFRDGITHAHNMFADAAWQAGVPGVIAQTVLVFSVVVRLYRELRNHSADLTLCTFALGGLAGAIGFILKNQTDDFFRRDVSLLFWLINGALLSVLCKDGSLQGGQR